MGIRYLTFKADVVGLNDLVSVYDLGKCTITISDIAGATTQLNTATKERVITELALMCENYEHWTAPISVNSSLSYSSDYLDLLQSVLPMVASKDIPFEYRYTGRIKLVAANGYYAVSDTIGADAYGVGPMSYVLYNPDGTMAYNGFPLPYTRNEFKVFGFAGYEGGEIPSTQTSLITAMVQPYANGNRQNWYWRRSGFNTNADAIAWLNSIPGPDYHEDPYAQGGTSKPGGGDGTFDWESDEVPIAPLPSIGAMNSGFINLYMPTLAELQNLARYMWAGAFDIDSLKKIVADPMDVILGLSILPVTQAEAGATDGSILIGNLDSQIQCKVAQKQFVQIDCGTIEILPKWGAYLDFSPHSKLQLYLPYIGFVNISPDDCMNGTISVAYNIDILSGACLAQVHCTSPGKDEGEIYDHVLYEFTGNCATECPVTSGQYRNILSSIFSIASGVASSASTGDLTPAVTETAEAIKDTFKPQVTRSGGPGKNTGMLGHQAPYLVLTCPRMIIPGDQNAMIGYPSYVTLELGDITGFTQVDTIHLAGVPASEAEQNEIINLLREGVYL